MEKRDTPKTRSMTIHDLPVANNLRSYMVGRDYGLLGKQKQESRTQLETRYIVELFK